VGLGVIRRGYRGVREKVLGVGIMIMGSRVWIVLGRQFVLCLCFLVGLHCVRLTAALCALLLPVDY